MKLEANKEFMENLSLQKSNLGSLFSMSRKTADKIIPSKIQHTFAR